VPANKARKSLQKFPGIGGPGADKILVQEPIKSELRIDFPWLIVAHQLLRQHGGDVQISAVAARWSLAEKHYVYVWVSPGASK
jgi:hypothetical protein